MNYLRVILDPPSYCNYRCILCHREGIQPGKRKIGGKKYIDNSILFNVYQNAKLYGYYGLVFTGGEPLLEPKLFELLKLFQSELTMITTNASLLSHKMIRNLKTASLNQLNISFCSTDQNIYYKVTRQSRYRIETLTKSINEAIEKGLRVQLNTVLYKNINDDMQDLNAILDFSYNTGVAKIVFIIAMIPYWEKKSHNKLSPEYKVIRGKLAAICPYVGTAKRGEKFVFKKVVEVVLTRCTNQKKINENIANSDLCVDMNGYLIPTVFSCHRIPIIQGQEKLAVEDAVALKKNTNAEEIYE